MSNLKRLDALSEAIERLEAVIYTSDTPQVDYRDLSLVLSEMRLYRDRMYVEIYNLEGAVIDMLAVRYPELMADFARLRNRDMYYEWERTFIDAMIAEADVNAQQRHVLDAYRAPCPLCGDTPQQGHAAVFGFAIPEGLHRHLSGYGAMRQCAVTAMVHRLVHRQFRD